MSTSIFSRSPDVVCRQVGAESVLVPIRQHVGNLDYVYTLSAVAASVWELLDGTKNVGTIVDAICDEYDIDRDTAASDVSALLTDLGEAALISQVS
ncbi:MAG TPA: PqqD family protein [Vicinamibacterales bacterium]|nr:PqqD family protein [Vicinamibacterales bacterium]